MEPTATDRSIDALWRMEAPRLIARVTRIVGDVGVAEELAQDVLLTALEQWPDKGVPDSPAAWWMTAAKHRAIDHVRQRQRQQQKQAALSYEWDMQTQAGPDDDDRLQDDVGDELLRLMFIACHPLLPLPARVALTLRLLGGLSTEEIARAFLQSEPTIAQRIVRAKKTLAQKKVPFEVPRKADWEPRLEAVLQVIYLVFNEGYSATSGEDWLRPALCEEALRLGRVLSGLLPHSSEVHGLLALMELQASRNKARLAADGSPVLLLQQDRARWDHLQIQRGLNALNRALELGGAQQPYALQAAIAACHALARQPEQTDWRRIVALYTQLAVAAPSPIIELNRAVAIAQAEGAATALPLVQALANDAALKDYPHLPAVHGDLLQQLGRLQEARVAFKNAAALTRNQQQKQLLLARAAACRPAGGDGLPQ